MYDVHFLERRRVKSHYYHDLNREQCIGISQSITDKFAKGLINYNVMANC